MCMQGICSIHRSGRGCMWMIMFSSSSLHLLFINRPASTFTRAKNKSVITLTRPRSIFSAWYDKNQAHPWVKYITSNNQLDVKRDVRIPPPLHWKPLKLAKHTERWQRMWRRASSRPVAKLRQILFVFSAGRHEELMRLSGTALSSGQRRIRARSLPPLCEAPAFVRVVH